jgi:hypothetical protein
VRLSPVWAARADCSCDAAAECGHVFPAWLFIQQFAE